ncbi:MAG: NADH:ubiquinone oxidoreductase [Planctomycetes bacterium]|jgi:[NiFe] hydrogenase diaphorase moiety large subunit|nr:NADH:ubiquinone oxidoreductase [Planctomycetota bacterium]
MIEKSLPESVGSICKKYKNSPDRLMDIAIDIQHAYRCVSPEVQLDVAQFLQMDVVDVQSLVTFYSFLTEEETGKIVVRLCNDVPDKLAGSEEVAVALSCELGLDFDETSEDGQFTLLRTPCIGMSDQAPAVMVNEIIITSLTPDSARKMARQLIETGNPYKLVKEFGDGRNSNDLIKSMVNNNLQLRGPVLFSGPVTGRGLESALKQTPKDVRQIVKDSGLRGRGGAGFPTGLKWDFTAAAEGEQRYVLCNADEGEPGTFKDRVLLTEMPELMFEGMTIAAYAIGASEGLVYLRGEYFYLKAFLEHALELRRKSGLLGKNILGHDGFDFDIRIQLGAGAYICGEESALISSCEGLRGDPKNRPPFPAQKGYKQCPTSVNNVESLCAAARILEHGAEWFAGFGEARSTGTKVLSVSGDCEKPGVYEIPNGVTLYEFLDMCGGRDAQAVQVGGAAGHLIHPTEFGRRLTFDDLATGGSMMVFGPEVDLIDVAVDFLDFFVEESCGYCTPCRAGNVLLLERMKRIQNGRGETGDYEYLADLANSIKGTSRCGLGQTSPNIVLDLLRHFRPLLESRIGDQDRNLRASFDLDSALKDAELATGRKSVHNQEGK